jgi:hypothetical protein
MIHSPREHPCPLQLSLAFALHRRFGASRRIAAEGGRPNPLASRKATALEAGPMPCLEERAQSFGLPSQLGLP